MLSNVNLSSIWMKEVSNLVAGVEDEVASVMMRRLVGSRQGCRRILPSDTFLDIHVYGILNSHLMCS
jgi:hypothetical protein